jgi:glycosyltransferase involved in cell wall biosynthesis
MTQKKVLIIGSIADFGGREVEVKNIIKALSNHYEIELLSTIPMTAKSMAITDGNLKWTTIQKELFDSKLLIKITSCLSKFRNNFKRPAYFLVSNSLSNLFYNFHIENLKIIKSKIDEVQVVVFCGVFENGYLEEIYEYSSKKNKPFLLRTTGTITTIPHNLVKIMPQMDAILVHSYVNATKIKNISSDNIHIIDQSTLHELELLKLPIVPKQQFVYGYLGRFSAEKGVLEMLESFRDSPEKLILAGSGPLEKEVITKCGSNITLLGELPQDQIDLFFKSIDVLIIPSLEEAGPLVGIEAMAGGKLIFSTVVGAMKERLIMSDNEFWIGDKISDSIEELMVKVRKMDSNEIVKIRELNRKVYLGNYSIEKVSKQYVQLINSFQV